MFIGRLVGWPICHNFLVALVILFLLLLLIHIIIMRALGSALLNWIDNHFSKAGEEEDYYQDPPAPTLPLHPTAQQTKGPKPASAVLPKLHSSPSQDNNSNSWMSNKHNNNINTSAVKPTTDNHNNYSTTPAAPRREPCVPCFSFGAEYTEAVPCGLECERGVRVRALAAVPRRRDQGGHQAVSLI